MILGISAANVEETQCLRFRFTLLVGKSFQLNTITDRNAEISVYFIRKTKCIITCHIFNSAAPVINFIYSIHYLPEPMSPAEENLTPSLVHEITTDSPN